MAEHAIYLSFNNQAEGFRIPVNPESIEISEGSNGNTFDIMGELDNSGEIHVIKGKKLLEVSFSSLFPAVNYPFVVAPLLEPSRYVKFIEGWMSSKRPIRFIYVGRLHSSDNRLADINMAASIESFTWKEVAGAAGDIEYSLQLKEYKFYQPVQTQVIEVDGVTMIVPMQPERPDERERPITYTLQEGESLWSVARKLLGDGARYKEIQRINNIRDCDLKRLPIGMQLLLPED